VNLAPLREIKIRNANREIRKLVPILESRIRSALLHSAKDDVKGLTLDCLKIDPPKLVLLRVVRQRVRTARVIRRAQLNEDFHRRTITRGLGFGDVDRSGIEIRRVDRAAWIDGPDLQNIAAVGPKPAAIERLKIDAPFRQQQGDSEAHYQHRDQDDN
jgi:hypothetical protein